MRCKIKCLIKLYLFKQKTYTSSVELAMILAKIRKENPQAYTRLLNNELSPRERDLLFCRYSL